MAKFIEATKDKDLMRAWAEISPNGTYRHYLQRTYHTGKGIVLFVMLNPSTADAKYDDPTIQKCAKYTKRWGFKTFVVLNLFDYRATEPGELKKAFDPFGPKRRTIVQDFAMGINPMLEHLKVVCAWGNHGKLWGRDEEMIAMLRKEFDWVPLECFKQNKNGTPVHPLYQADAAETVPFIHPGAR